MGRCFAGCGIIRKVLNELGGFAPIGLLDVAIPRLLVNGDMKVASVTFGFIL
jgi:hypothetical protein